MLWKKFLRDVWTNKIQFFSILLMAALSTYIYVGMGAVWNGLDSSLNEYYKETNYADYIMTSVEGYSDEDIYNIKNIKNVLDISKRYTINDCVAIDQDNAKITMHILEDYKISKCNVIKGSDVDIDEDGIWLDYRYADEHKLNVGDYLTLKINDVSIECEIKGLVINPEYIYQANNDSIIPNHKIMGFAYMSYNYAKNLVLDKPNELLIKVKDNTKLDIKDIEKRVVNYGLLRSREDIMSHTMFNDAIRQYKAVGIVYPLAFLAVTLLTMLTTMTRLVDKQRIQIGTFQAIGIKKRKIYKHYMSFGFITSFIGCLIGFIIGPLSLPYIYYDVLKDLYTMEYWRPNIPNTSIIIIILCVGLCTFITYNAIAKILKESPSQAIKPKVSEELASIDVLNNSFVKKLNFSLKWNYIDIIKGRGRACMTIAGILGCMGLLVAGFGLRDSLDDVIQCQYKDIYKFNTKLSIDTLDITEYENNINNIKNNYSNVDLVYEGQIEILSKNNRKISTVLVEDDIKNITYIDEKKEKIKLDKDKVNISQKLAESLGVKKGDKIKFRIIGTSEYKELTIGKIYLSPVTQGITISKDLYENQGYTLIYNYAFTSDEVSSKEPGILNIISKESLKKDYLTTRKTIDSIAWLLVGSAILLAIVVLYNLNTLALFEKKSEFALLKVMGFKSVRIRNLLLTQTIILANIGVVIGVFFGKWLLDMVLSSMGDSIDIRPCISLMSYLISFILTLGVSVIINMCFIYNIKKINMVLELKNDD